MATKAELMERRGAILKQLVAVRSELIAVERALRDIILAEVGLKVGDKVRHRDGTVGIVCKIDLWAYDNHGGRPFVTARLFKKNGSLGLQERSFYDRWERVEEQPL